MPSVEITTQQCSAQSTNDRLPRIQSQAFSVTCADEAFVHPRFFVQEAVPLLET